MAISWPEYDSLVTEKTAKYKITDTESASQDSKIIRIVFSSSVLDDAAKSEATEKIIPDLLKGPFSAVPEIYKTPYLELVAKERPKLIARTAKYVFLPPILVLILGWSIAWVIGGFRREQKHA